jgi:hypothetical protein
MGVLQDLEAGNFSAVFHDIAAGWQGSTVGSAIDTAATAAWAELKTIAPGDLLSIVENVGTSILAGVAAGNPTSAIISEGISLAEQAFVTAGKTVAATTLSTFVAAVHNQAVTAVPVAATPVAAAPAEAAPVDPAPAA